MNSEIYPLQAANYVEISTNALRQQLRDYSEVGKSLFDNLNEQLESSKRTINRLKEQKKELKKALENSLYKRDQLFHEASELYKQLRQLQSRPRIDRDEQAMSFHSKQIEFDRDSVAKSIKTLMSYTQADKDTYSMLKKSIGCASSVDFHISSGKLESIIDHLVQFIIQVLQARDKSKNPKDKFIQTSAKLMEELPMQIDRVSKLNKEIMSSLEKSKYKPSEPDKYRALSEEIILINGIRENSYAHAKYMDKSLIQDDNFKIEGDLSRKASIADEHESELYSILMTNKELENNTSYMNSQRRNLSCTFDGENKNENSIRKSSSANRFEEDDIELYNLLLDNKDLENDRHENSFINLQTEITHKNLVDTHKLNVKEKSTPKKPNIAHKSLVINNYDSIIHSRIGTSKRSASKSHFINNSQLKESRIPKKSIEQKGFMGPTSDILLPPMRKEDGWTPREMFSFDASR